MKRTSFEERYLGRLLVAHGKHVLESRVPISKLIATSLFSFDTLPACRFLARTCDLLHE